MTGYVYMTASKKGGTIYIGVTNSLGRRLVCAAGAVLRVTEWIPGFPP